MTATTAPLVKSLAVPAAPERAIAVFVDELAAWWPLGAFSVGGETSTAAFERDADGRAVRLVETLADGTTTDWGRVTRWSSRRSPSVRAGRADRSRLAGGAHRPERGDGPGRAARPVRRRERRAPRRRPPRRPP